MARCQRDYDPTIGRFASLDPAKDRRGDGDLYDYCMDDPVSRVDPTGLWSKANFDESKVSRDGLGQFASTPGAGSGSGGGGGGGVPLTPDQMGEAHGNNYFPGSRMPGPEQWQSKPLSEELRQALADNRSHYSRAGQGPDGAQAPFGWKLEDINDNGEEKIRPLPKAPDPIPPGHPLTRFEELAIEKGHANRETLPQYSLVSNGIALNSGDHKGFETRDLRANSEILVYVTSGNFLPVDLEVQAGPSFHKNERQVVHLGAYGDAVLRFNSHGDLIRFLSITSNTASLPGATPEGQVSGADSFLVRYNIYSRGHYARR